MGRKRIRRYQDTAIDDAIRISALKICDRNDQKTIIEFIDSVFEKCPFRIHTVRTDRGTNFRPSLRAAISLW